VRIDKIENRMNEITPAELREKLKSNESILLVDVREPYEHEEFNIGGILVPLADIPYSAEKITEPGADVIVLYCRSGNRSVMAQKLLAMQHGITNTLNPKGGIIAWKEEINRQS
jgi:rhodanese-related sulfurtransferase